MVTVNRFVYEPRSLQLAVIRPILRRDRDTCNKVDIISLYEVGTLYEQTNGKKLYHFQLCVLPRNISAHAKYGHSLLIIKTVVCVYGHTYNMRMDQPGKVANPARGQLSHGIMNISLSAFVPKNLVSRDGFGSPILRQRALSPYTS